MFNSSKDTLRNLLTFPAAYILTDIGFRVFNIYSDNLNITLLKYATVVVLMFPFYWFFGFVGQRHDKSSKHSPDC